MGKIHHFLNGLNPDEGISEDMKQALLAAYDDDLSVPQSKIGSLESTIAEQRQAIADREAKLAAAKAENYDLVKALPKSEEDAEPNPYRPEPVQYGFDDLFGEKE